MLKNMNLKQIKNIISKHNELITLAESKIKVIEKFDFQYYTSNGVEKISFDNDLVNVQCDDTHMGCYDTYEFNFPIEWLFKTDSELEELVVTARELKKEKERKAEKEMQLKAKEEAEQRELEQYKRLKEKYDKK